MNFVESENMELKSIYVDDIKKEIIAFANTRGGSIYIGVEDDGTTRPNTRYLSEMRRLCEAAKRLSIPLEINQLGYCDRRNYPSDLFFSIAGEIGNDVLIGCDAHHPKQLLDAYSIHGAEQLAKRCGVSLMDHLTLRSPFEAMK